MLGARLLTVGMKVLRKQEEEARIIQMVMHKSWRHQGELIFKLTLNQIVTSF